MKINNNRNNIFQLEDEISKNSNSPNSANYTALSRKLK